ncbi:hypothetical protein GJ496_008715 [Pomphorhynchus laevis]|nr:hypothetical protein GJ496_008715 [Pomphorhynchus laevis]
MYLHRNVLNLSKSFNFGICSTTAFPHCVLSRCLGHTSRDKILSLKNQRNCKYQNRIKRAIIDANGDTNSYTNDALRRIIDAARKDMVPNSYIESSIKQFTAGDNSKMYVIEMLGPNRCSVCVEVFCEKPRRVVSEINNVVRRMLSRGAYLCESPTINFVVNGEILIGLAEFKDVDPFEIALDIGAEEFEVIDSDDDADTTELHRKQIVKFSCDPSNLQNLESKLKFKGYHILQSQNQWIPRRVIALNETERKVYDLLIEKLQNFPSIISIHSNVSEDITQS